MAPKVAFLYFTCMTTRRLFRYERMSSNAKSHRAGVPWPPCGGVLIRVNGIHSGAPQGVPSTANETTRSSFEFELFSFHFLMCLH